MIDYIDLDDREICGHRQCSGECPDCCEATQTQTGIDDGCYCCGSRDVDDEQICSECRDAETVLGIRRRK